jgi:hypothetical protein
MGERDKDGTINDILPKFDYTDLQTEEIERRHSDLSKEVFHEL